MRCLDLFSQSHGDTETKTELRSANVQLSFVVREYLRCGLVGRPAHNVDIPISVCHWLCQCPISSGCRAASGRNHINELDVLWHGRETVPQQKRGTGRASGTLLVAALPLCGSVRMVAALPLCGSVRNHFFDRGLLRRRARAVGRAADGRVIREGAAGREVLALE